MKLKLFFLIILACVGTRFYAQVGINTTNPRTALEVAGTAQLLELEVEDIPEVEDGQKTTFLIQTSDEYIYTLDASNPESTALAYLMVYNLVNPDGDLVLNYNTLIPADTYDVFAISAYYDKELSSNQGNQWFSIPYYAAFIEGGTWRLTADYPRFTNQNESDVGTWTITVVVYSKTLSKNLGNPTVNMNGSGTGTATTPLLD